MFRRTKGTIGLLMTLAVATLALATTADAQRSRARRTSAEPARRDATDDRTIGFMLGVHTIAAPGVSVSGSDIDGTFSTTFGAGAGVMLGYGFNETFSAFVSLDVAKQQTSEDSYPEGTFGLAHMEIGARANLPIKSANLLPYLTASVGRRALGAHVTEEETDEEYDTSLSGAMIAFGGGIQHFFSPTMALDAGVQLSYGKLGTWMADGDEESINVNGSTAIRLRVGINWRP